MTLPTCYQCHAPMEHRYSPKPIPIRGHDYELSCSGTCEDEYTPVITGRSLEACIASYHEEYRPDTCNECDSELAPDGACYPCGHREVEEELRQLRSCPPGCGTAELEDRIHRLEKGLEDDYAD